MKNTLKLVAFIFLAVFAVAMLACRQKVVPLVGISFDEETLYIDGGTSQKLVVKFDPPNATDKSVTWSSSDDTKVSVAEDGTITAKAHTPNDKATITVKSTDGEHTATCEVIVKVVPVQRVVLPSILYADIYAGTTLQAKIEPENATYKTVTWSSADESIATVDKNGVVIFGGQIFDNVEITATAYGEVASATSKVYIIKAPEVTQLPGSTEGLTEDDVPANFVRIGPCAMPLGADASQNVTITRAYEISDHEVTQKEFMDVMELTSYGFFFDNTTEDKDGTIAGSTNKYSPTISEGENQSKRPVENANWFAAIAYCSKRSNDEGKNPCYTIEGVDWSTFKWGDLPNSDEARAKWYAVECDFTKDGYRLPTEAEWEIAARAEMGGDVWAGTSEVNKVIEYGWISVNSGKTTHEVKLRKPNGYGLYDMTGNVSELCWDVWNKTSPPSGEDPVGDTHTSTSTDVVKMGGAFAFQQSNCSVSARSNAGAKFNSFYIGFRVVRNASK